MKQKLQKTIVLRKCLNCEGSMGIGIWPWSGQRFTVSHGLCRSCFEELEEAAQASEADAPLVRRAPEEPAPHEPGWHTASGI